MPEQNQNLAVWDAVKKTDMSFVKETDMGGYKHASINHLWAVRKATELWGPMGGRWGYNILEERGDQMAPVWVEGQLLGHNITHTVKLELWYPEGDLRGSVVNFGHTPWVYWSRKYKSFDQDDEAPKKSVSDAIKKCMSFLGFSADIYSGQWDDPAYRQERRLETDIEKAEDKDAERDKQQTELVDYTKRNIEAIERAQQLSEAAGVFKVAVRHIERQRAFPHLQAAADKGSKAISIAYDKKKSELEKDAKQ